MRTKRTMEIIYNYYLDQLCELGCPVSSFRLCIDRGQHSEDFMGRHPTSLLEEDVRFELTEPCGPTGFKPVALNHSANLPN